MESSAADTRPPVVDSATATVSPRSVRSVAISSVSACCSASRNGDGTLPPPRLDRPVGVEPEEYASVADLLVPARARDDARLLRGAQSFVVVEREADVHHAVADLDA